MLLSLSDLRFSSYYHALVSAFCRYSAKRRKRCSRLPKGESSWCLRTWDNLLVIARTDENLLAWVLGSCLGCEGMNQEQVHRHTDLKAWIKLEVFHRVATWILGAFIRYSTVEQVS